MTAVEDRVAQGFACVHCHGEEGGMQPIGADNVRFIHPGCIPLAEKDKAQAHEWAAEAVEILRELDDEDFQLALDIILAFRADPTFGNAAARLMPDLDAVHALATQRLAVAS